MKKIIYSLIIVSNLSYTMDSEKGPNATQLPPNDSAAIFMADWLDLDDYGSDCDADDWLSHNQMPSGTGNTGGAAAANSEVDDDAEKPPTHIDVAIEKDDIFLLILKRFYSNPNIWLKAYRKDGKLTLKSHSGTDDTNLPY